MYVMHTNVCGAWDWAAYDGLAHMVTKYRDAGVLYFEDESETFYTCIVLTRQYKLNGMRSILFLNTDNLRHAYYK